jgi:hypothetical protein
MELCQRNVTAGELLPSACGRITIPTPQLLDAANPMRSQGEPRRVRNPSGRVVEWLANPPPPNCSWVSFLAKECDADKEIVRSCCQIVNCPVRESLALQSLPAVLPDTVGGVLLSCYWVYSRVRDVGRNSNPTPSTTFPMRKVFGNLRDLGADRRMEQEFGLRKSLRPALRAYDSHLRGIESRRTGRMNSIMDRFCAGCARTECFRGRGRGCRPTLLTARCPCRIRPVLRRRESARGQLFSRRVCIVFPRLGAQ